MNACKQWSATSPAVGIAQCPGAEHLRPASTRSHAHEEVAFDHHAQYEGLPLILEAEVAPYQTGKAMLWA
jgi:hypothetical protein